MYSKTNMFFFCNFQVALGGPPMKCMKTNHESIGNELCDAEFRPIFQWRCYIYICAFINCTEFGGY